MKQQVCSKENRCDLSSQDLQNRCWFFSTLIDLVQPVHNMFMNNGMMQNIPMYGGEDIVIDEGQFKGKDIKSRFSNVFGSIADVDIDMIEVHLFKENYGIVHAFVNGQNISKNTQIYTFGFFLNQNSIHLTSIDAVVTGISSNSTTIYPPASIPFENVKTKDDLKTINLATQASFQQLLSTTTKQTQPLNMQQIPVVVSGGRKKKDKMAENRKKKV
jgi:hypothetical protein